MPSFSLRPERSRFVTSSADWRDAPPADLPMVVVAGRSNVGKSSFINFILKRRNLARTSQTPGRTQLLNYFEVDGALLLVDVPGYGYAEAPREVVARWIDNLERFIAAARGIEAVVQLFDLRRKPSGEDLKFAASVRASGHALVVVATKADKISRGRRAEHVREIARALEIAPGQIVVTSAHAGEGRERVWERIAALLFDAAEQGGAPPLDVVAVDGPSGAGKSTVARALARRLGWRYLDTGAMYRAVGLKADRLGVALDDDAALADLCARTTISFADGPEGAPLVLLDGEDVSSAIREHRVSSLASKVSARKPVREAMARFQREIGEASPTVAEGRDMGTVVFPEARLKIYLTAAPESRAKRRTLELEARGEAASYERILADILERDENDSSREHAPLMAAPDAATVDTTGLTVEEVVAAIVAKLAPEPASR